MPSKQLEYNFDPLPLKTPLTMIKGNIQLAQRRLATLKRQLVERSEGLSEKLEQLQDTLASAAQGARLQERIIKAMMDDASIQSNTLELHPTRLDLNTLLRETVATQQRAAPERTIMLEGPPPEHVVPVMADAEQIRQVITCYLVNALSYSPADQPVIVQLTVDGAEARVSVQDQGPGIPEEEQEHIWERFYHARGMAVQHEPGLSLGLGLYLSRVFIERHHGSVGVQSGPGQGATFWFTLPVEETPPQAPGRTTRPLLRLCRRFWDILEARQRPTDEELPCTLIRRPLFFARTTASWQKLL